MNCSSDRVAVGYEADRARPEITVVLPTRSRRPRLSTVSLPRELPRDDVALDAIAIDSGSGDGTPARSVELCASRVHVHVGVVRERGVGNLASAVGALLGRRGTGRTKGLLELLRSRSTVEAAPEILESSRLAPYRPPPSPW